MKRVHGYLAEFESPKALYKAAKEAHAAGFKNWDVHSPLSDSRHGRGDGAGGVRSSRISSSSAELQGFLPGSFLQQQPRTDVWKTVTGIFSKVPGLDSIPYSTIVQAKPTNIFTTPAFFPVIFELTVLFSAFTTLFVLLALCKLSPVQSSAL